MKWGTREKRSLFIRKKTAFFSGTPNFFGPSYFEAALVPSVLQGQGPDHLNPRLHNPGMVLGPGFLFDLTVHNFENFFW